ncbi:hypothetical protein SAMN05660642_00948 [Geodermatophilus siccatus]|uniref:Uncharacterized protein n=1 Tax=Geodermatophilus siccatus TaxID=1137991 RepID=A0A1G9NBA2_9ACTN|nr:hypothetical protein SAMN05660642_00948 [Geodermatophilus siccatus]
MELGGGHVSSLLPTADRNGRVRTPIAMTVREVPSGGATCRVSAATTLSTAAVHGCRGQGFSDLGGTDLHAERRPLLAGR